jgi:hypothetical protein
MRHQAAEQLTNQFSDEIANNNLCLPKESNL